MSPVKLPSQAQRKALIGIARGRARRYPAPSPTTTRALVAAGLIDGASNLTDAGRQMIQRLTIAPEVRHGA